MSADNKGHVQVSGRVLDVTNRSGISKATQSAYSIDTVTLLTGKSVTEVTWSDDAGHLPKEDETVTVNVSLSTYAGRLQVNALSRVGSPGVRAAV